MEEIKKGKYDTDQSEILINTKDPVTLKLDGNITCRGSSTFINMLKTCTKVTVEGNGYKITRPEDSEDMDILENRSKANVILKNGSYEAKTGSYAMSYNCYGGTIDAETVNFIGGTIANSSAAISANKISLGEDATFDNNEQDINLKKESQFNIFKKGDTYTDSEGGEHKITKKQQKNLPMLENTP